MERKYSIPAFRYASLNAIFEEVIQDFEYELAQPD